MSRHDPTVYMRHMLDFAREAVEVSRGRTRSDLDTDRLYALAVRKLIEMIGEAAGCVPHDVQDAHPDVSWAKAIGMRHRLTHGYDIVNYDIVWDTIVSSLPPLIAALEAALPPLPE